MKEFFILMALLVEFISTCNAVTTNCGCAPGNQGHVGQQGITGIKGERGDVGDTGFRGPQGPPGLQGLKGDVGNQGPRGAEPSYFGYYYPGPRGPAGPPGVCGCPNLLNQQVENPLQRFKTGELYYSDGDGILHYMGQQYPEQNLQRKPTTTTTTTTTTPLPLQPPTNAAPSQGFNSFASGLFTLGPDGVLVPFHNAHVYDLFAKISGGTTTTPSPTTTTTTTTPEPAKNEKIYILGPKGSLIPLDALGIKKPSAHGGGGHGIKFTSSYNKWLRGMLMGELLPDYDEEMVSTYTNYDEEEQSK